MTMTMALMMRPVMDADTDVDVDVDAATSIAGIIIVMATCRLLWLLPLSGSSFNMPANLCVRIYLKISSDFARRFCLSSSLPIGEN